MKIKSLLLTIFFICSAFQCENDENIPEEKPHKFGNMVLAQNRPLFNYAEHLVYLSVELMIKLLKFINTI
jgi:hypothetical protein